MNRKQRRAEMKQTASRGWPATTPAAAANELFHKALWHRHHGQLPEAVRLFKQLLALTPDHAEAHNNLGSVLQAQGKLHEASASFAQAITLMPQLLEDAGSISALIAAVLPPFGEAIRRTAAVWPNQLTTDQLLGTDGFAAIATDPLLLCLLKSAPPQNAVFERVLATLRTALLDAAVDTGKPVSDAALAFCCTLAEQCFINEYVFATTPDENARLNQLKTSLRDALISGAPVPPIWLAAIAMYEPLHALPYAQSLLGQSWPPVLDAILSQQLREPAQEQELAKSIPRLTPIDDDISRRVQQQYEENPYPRWIRLVGGVEPIALDLYLRGLFPTAAFNPHGKDDVEVLVAGCGTGRHALWLTQRLQGARVLAVDLSASSLSFAKRKTPAPLSERISYMQGDILKLDTIGRSFDLIDASGVLHHMADPFEGWRTLLKVLRPGGFMHVCLYSEIGRRDVVEARAFIAAHGFTPTPADIRRCRQELLATPMGSVVRFKDFFTTSECRDLLFHVQERRMTIPQVKSFIDENRLQFIGFDLDPLHINQCRSHFAQAGWSMQDLERWREYESRNPDTFTSMYQFWVQKT